LIKMEKKIISKLENKEQMKGYLKALKDVKDLISMLEEKFLEEALPE